MTSAFHEPSTRTIANRRQRRSSAIAVTTETQHLLECIQCTVQVNDDIAHLHDLLIQLGSNKDGSQVRVEINNVIRHCLDVARNAKERFLYIVLNCRENLKLQNQAGQQLGIFGFCLTYMQGELKKGLNLITSFPLQDNQSQLTTESIQNDLMEIDGILHTVEKHVHYIAESDTPTELFRRKSDRATSSRHVTARSVDTDLHSAGSVSSTVPPTTIAAVVNSNPFCQGLLCMPTKKNLP